MSNEIIKNLLDALSVSPDNIPLRMQVAAMMMNEKMYADAASAIPGNFKTKLW